MTDTRILVQYNKYFLSFADNYETYAVPKVDAFTYIFHNEMHLIILCYMSS